MPAVYGAWDYTNPSFAARSAECIQNWLSRIFLCQNLYIHLFKSNGQRLSLSLIQKLASGRRQFYGIFHDFETTLRGC